MEKYEASAACDEVPGVFIDGDGWHDGRDDLGVGVRLVPIGRLAKCAARSFAAFARCIISADFLRGFRSFPTGTEAGEVLTGVVLVVPGEDVDPMILEGVVKSMISGTFAWRTNGTSSSSKLASSMVGGVDGITAIADERTESSPSPPLIWKLAGVPARGLESVTSRLASSGEDNWGIAGDDAWLEWAAASVFAGAREPRDAITAGM